MSSGSTIFEGELETLADGFQFTEGPVWMPTDGSVIFVDIRTRTTYRWSPDGGVEVFRENNGEANGSTLDLQGRLVTCEMTNRRISRTEPDGNVVTLADRFQGKRLSRTNDIVGRSDGILYFTDPEMRTPKEERELDSSGVYYITPDGEVHLGTNELPYPNGIAFSPDESLLYVDNSRIEGCVENEESKGLVCNHRYIQVYDVAADGSISNGRKFADLSSAEPGVPDGMKVDSAGNVFCTANGGVCVIGPDGADVEFLKTPEVTANLAFGGDDRRDVYLTTSTTLLRIRVKTPGVRIPGT